MTAVLQDVVTDGYPEIELKAHAYIMHLQTAVVNEGNKRLCFIRIIDYGWKKVTWVILLRSILKMNRMP